MSAAQSSTSFATLSATYQAVRSFSEAICQPLEIEDYVVQSMPDCSPAKWHLAHTTWFFETFLLRRFLPDYSEYHPRFAFLFNSYYESAGERTARPERGLLSRPTVREVYAYRHAVDQGLRELLAAAEAGRVPPEELRALVEIGLHHEQQHQELLFTDIKHMLAQNPLRPAYRAPAATPANPVARGGSRSGAGPGFLAVPGGVYEIGHAGPGFAYDNEGPRHRVLLADFQLACRPVTCGEYLEFMRSGGYEDFRHWLADGWHRVRDNDWRAPLYWEVDADGGWWMFTLSGPRPVNPDEILTHISFHEAYAYASWAGRRLPTEFEWEAAVCHFGLDGNDGNFARAQSATEAGDGPAAGAASAVHPGVATAPGEAVHMFGDVWEWTASAYLPYPGYRPLDGALGEYNGKFMIDQMVLRGGSCATPAGHVRATYRNFFQPYQRWQFSGLRLAADEGPRPA